MCIDGVIASVAKADDRFSLMKMLTVGGEDIAFVAETKTALEFLLQGYSFSDIKNAYGEVVALAAYTLYVRYQPHAI